MGDRARVRARRRFLGRIRHVLHALAGQEQEQLLQPTVARQLRVECRRQHALLADQNRLKLYHFARFDLAAIEHYLGVEASPVFCTKIASKLVRTYTDRHGLKNLVEELLGESISKQQQSSDWGGPDINDAQRDYAASDVRYLHRMREELVTRLEREGRMDMAQACFDFLPTRARLDLAGWEEHDIFHHS